jgi:hypothetical protein
MPIRFLEKPLSCEDLALVERSTDPPLWVTRGIDNNGVVESGSLNNLGNSDRKIRSRGDEVGVHISLPIGLLSNPGAGVAGCVMREVDGKVDAVTNKCCSLR